MLNRIIRVGDEDSQQGIYPDYTDAPVVSGFDPSAEEDEEEEEAVEVSSEMLHSKSGKLMYSSLSNLWARWVFSQDDENLFPIVLINGNVMCKDHSTYHIVRCKIEKKKGTEKVKMTMRSSGKDCRWNGSAKCTYQLWGGTKEFSDAGGHGKQKEGTCGGGMSFTINIGTDDYQIT